MAGQPRNQRLTKTASLIEKHGEQLLPQLLKQRAFRLCRPMPQHRHALHEELVEIGGEDGEKLGPFQQGRTLVESLGKNTLIEIQPAQIAIDPNVRTVPWTIERSALRGRQSRREQAHS